MDKQQYNKPYLSIPQQIQHLQDKGLLFHNIQYAQMVLKHIAYYRLSGYFAHFQDINSNRFYANIYFEDVGKLYEFDVKLRLLILDAIGIIEISMRCCLIDNFADFKPYNPFILNNADIFEPKSKNLQSFYDGKAKCWGRSKEDFVKHFNYKYAFSPIWVEIETWTMGTIRDCIISLKPQYLHAMTKHFQCQDYNKLKNWTRCLVSLRNISAHHGRLWNKELLGINLAGKQFDFHEHIMTHTKNIKDYNIQNQTNINSNRKVYMYCIMIWHILKIVQPDSDWNIRLRDLMKTLPTHMPHVGLVNMGFANDWQQQQFWGLK